MSSSLTHLTSFVKRKVYFKSWYRRQLRRKEIGSVFILFYEAVFPYVRDSKSNILKSFLKLLMLKYLLNYSGICRGSWVPSGTFEGYAAGNKITVLSS